MKTKDIAKEYGINQEAFEAYLISINAAKYNLMGGMNLEGHIPTYIEGYKEFLVKEEEKKKTAEEEAERLRKAEEKKQKDMARMLITSGFSFDGYRIVKYSGYISGDDAVSIDRGKDGIFSSPTDVGQKLTDSLVQIRRQAIKELKEAAYDLGCNAVIGVDFDYITLDPQTSNASGGTTYLPYVFCVTANGNAVIIEKEPS